MKRMHLGFTLALLGCLVACNILVARGKDTFEAALAVFNQT